MLNYIWSFIIIIAVICGIFTGRLNEVSSAMLTGAENAVGLTISLLGMMCLWTGVMNIAENTGITDYIAKILSPLMRLLFPKLKDDKAKRAIVMNMTANMLGLSNAATPLGLNAMQELNKYAHNNTATDEMCMFIVINTASIQLIPSTVIAIRQGAGSVYPADIILPVWICSLCVVATGVLAVKIFSKRRK